MRSFDSHCHHIHHLVSLLSRDLRHRIQLGYQVISMPKYVTTTAKLYTTSFNDIIENIKADLTYFKEDLKNPDYFQPIQGQGTPTGFYPQDVPPTPPLDMTPSTSTPTFTKDTQLGGQRPADTSITPGGEPALIRDITIPNGNPSPPPHHPVPHLEHI